MTAATERLVLAGFIGFVFGCVSTAVVLVTAFQIGFWTMPDPQRPGTSIYLAPAEPEPQEVLRAKS